MTNHQIAQALGVRSLAVKSHLQNIFAKAGVGSRPALMARLGNIGMTVMRLRAKAVVETPAK